MDPAGATGGITLTATQIVVALLSLASVIGTLFGMLIKALNDRVNAYREILPLAKALDSTNRSLIDLVNSLENSERPEITKRLESSVENLSDTVNRLSDIATRAETMIELVTRRRGG